METQPTTRAAQRYYQSILRHRDQPMGFFAMTPMQWAATLGLALGILGVGAAVIAFTQLQWAGWILCGMGVGTLARDIGLRRRVVSSWPLLREVLHWEEIARRSGQSTQEGT